jgi:hypothetical protein
MQNVLKGHCRGFQGVLRGSSKGYSGDSGILEVSGAFGTCAALRVRACVRVHACLRVPRRFVGTLSGTAGICGIYSAAAAGEWPSVPLRWSSVRRRRAGGTWTCVNQNAPWKARSGHTSVIDATGAIYVIGGTAKGEFFNDLWVSTDRGADRTWGYSRGYSWVLTSRRAVDPGVL